MPTLANGLKRGRSAVFVASRRQKEELCNGSDSGDSGSGTAWIRTGANGFPTVTPAQAERAAELLLAARGDRRPIDALPESCRPASLDDGYAVQQALVSRLAARSGDPVGFKIGATSAKAQAFLDVPGPFSGRILAAGVSESPASLSVGDFVFCLIEPEFAFRMAGDLPARSAPYGEAEVAEAVAAVHPAIEVVTSAYGTAWSRAGASALVADNGVHGAFVLGLACEGWRGLDLQAHPVRLEVNGETVGEGVGANALGGPLTALTWLANQQSAFGRGLLAGDLVTTGVVTDFVEVASGDAVRADYGALGALQVSFTD